MWLIKLTLAKKGLDQCDLKFTWKAIRALLGAISALRPCWEEAGECAGGAGEKFGQALPRMPPLSRIQVERRGGRGGRLRLDTRGGLADDEMIMLKSFMHLLFY